MFKNKVLTFDDIDKLNYEQFTGKKKNGSKLKDDVFRPQDILDLDDESGTDDEILKKFNLNLGRRKKSNLSPKKKSYSGISRSNVPGNQVEQYQVNTPPY